VIDSLLDKTAMALRRERLDSLAVVGGVACNTGLREALRTLRRSLQPSAFSVQHSALSPQRSALSTQDSSLTRLWLPLPSLCTDNAAMIAGLGHHLALAGRRDNDLALNADPGWALENV
jgi:N6-L-threonylcarbamoyladenine synthase